jgi:hypothetical protein
MVEYISNDEYHKDKRISSSLLKAALISKAHLAQYLNEKRKPTDAMVLGTAVHTYYLEPEDIKRNIKPNLKRTNVLMELLKLVIISLMTKVILYSRLFVLTAQSFQAKA